MHMKFLKSSIVALTLTGTSVALAHGPRAYFEQADTNNDGSLSKAEATQYYDARFTEVDTDKDAVISRAEADAAKDKYRADFETKAKERFANKDANKDGKLQKTEVTHMPDAMFTRLDTNKDSALTPEEMRAFGPRPGPGRGMKHGDKPKGAPDDHGKPRHVKHGGLFQMMDTNRDGNVTKDEARLVAEQHFARLDRNGDGNISTEEKPARHVRKGPKPVEANK
jgi:Ca2+-binding EF-hand superfamily protein